MKLEDCTKKELLFIIERLRSHALNSDKYFLKTALLEVEERRENKKIDEADRLLNYSTQKQKEYYDLLTPYEGESILNIPDPVLRKADAAMKEAQEADKKWAKLMGLDKKGAVRHG